MPSTAIRNEILSNSKSAVIKLGTQLLTDENGDLDHVFIAQIAEQVVRLRRDRGMRITIVSSGAIGVGISVLGLNQRPKDLGRLQAAAATGQAGLVQSWNAAFAEHGYQAAQVLTTRGDFEDRDRYLNLRNCIHHLHELNTIPIVNENDAISVKEIKLGDNDFLAAMLANALRVDTLILLTVVDGLKDQAGLIVDLVKNTADAVGHVTCEKSKLGTGGMRTKLQAAGMVAEAGEIAVIANGREPDLLWRLFSGEKLGTVYMPNTVKMDSRDRWIGMTVRPAGRLIVDTGAVKALNRGGVSLLAKGITECDGGFVKGDVISIIDQEGHEVARGLSNYDSNEVVKILGQDSRSFEVLLGYSSYDEVVHCDNMVLIRHRD